MGRRDHLLRMALAANQAQIQEPVTPSDSDDEEVDENVMKKIEAIHKQEAAQEAILSASGIITDADKIKRAHENSKTRNVTAACSLVSYILPFPLYAARNLILTLDWPNTSYIDILQLSWRVAGGSLYWRLMPSLVIWNMGYSISMHYLQPRIVYKFKKLYPPADGNSAKAIFMRLGMSLGVNLAAWLVLYPLWRHAQLQSLLWLSPSQTLPPLRAFYPNHNWTNFFLSYTYNMWFWLLGIKSHRTFRELVYPEQDHLIEDHDGPYPSSLCGFVGSLVPTILFLPLEIVLSRRILREVAPLGQPALNMFEIANVGLIVKAYSAEWALEWAFLEAQYWVNEGWNWYKGYND